MALFVNETTLFPGPFPFAPSKTMIDRFPASLAAVVDAFGADTEFTDREIEQMNEHRLSKTVNRSTVGMLNEFAFLAGVHTRSTGAGDLINMSLRLSTTPCGPLSKRLGFPDREHHPLHLTATEATEIAVDTRPMRRSV